MPAFVAVIANEHKVGLSPGGVLTMAAGGVMVTFAFCGFGVVETGGGSAIVPRDRGVGEVGLAGGVEGGVDGGIVGAL